MMNCIHGFEKDVEPPVEGMHRCSCCGLNGSNIYIMAGAKWPRTDPLCQDCREAEEHYWRVMKYRLINSINGEPILMNGKPVIYNNKKDATAGAIGAAMWFGVPVSIREI